MRKKSRGAKLNTCMMDELTLLLRLLVVTAQLEKGSGTPNGKPVGSVTEAQLKEIAETKLPDLNAKDVDAAMKIIEGTAKNMGITIERS